MAESKHANPKNLAPANAKRELLGKLGHEVAAFLVDDREKLRMVNLHSWCGSLPLRLACALVTGAAHLRTSRSSTGVSQLHLRRAVTTPLGTSLPS